ERARLVAQLRGRPRLEPLRRRARPPARREDRAHGAYIEVRQLQRRHALHGYDEALGLRRLRLLKDPTMGHDTGLTREAVEARARLGGGPPPDNVKVVLA